MVRELYCQGDLTGQIGIIPVCPVFILGKILVQYIYEAHRIKDFKVISNITQPLNIYDG